MNAHTFKIQEISTGEIYKKKVENPTLYPHELRSDHEGNYADEVYDEQETYYFETPRGILMFSNEILDIGFFSYSAKTITTKVVGGVLPPLFCQGNIAALYKNNLYVFSEFGFYNYTKNVYSSYVFDEMTIYPTAPLGYIDAKVEYEDVIGRVRLVGFANGKTILFLEFDSAFPEIITPPEGYSNLFCWIEYDIKKNTYQYKFYESVPLSRQLAINVSYKRRAQYEEENI